MYLQYDTIKRTVNTNRKKKKAGASTRDADYGYPYQCYSARNAGGAGLRRRTAPAFTGTAPVQKLEESLIINNRRRKERLLDFWWRKQIVRPSTFSFSFPLLIISSLCIYLFSLLSPLVYRHKWDVFVSIRVSGVQFLWYFKNTSFRFHTLSTFIWDWVPLSYLLVVSKLLRRLKARCRRKTKHEYSMVDTMNW